MTTKKINPYMKKIGERIKSKRIASRLRVDYMSSMISIRKRGGTGHISEGYYRSIESGNAVPSEHVFRQIVFYLRISPDVFADYLLAKSFERCNK